MSTVAEHIAVLKERMAQLKVSELNALSDPIFQAYAVLFCAAHLEELEAAPLTEADITWGLDCNLEDATDEEAHAFERGVRFAEWKRGTVAASPAVVQASEPTPCPFCGSTPRHLTDKPGFWSERVICDTCHFTLGVDAWNRRAQPAQNTKED